MKNVDSVSILASFATLKTLSDGKRYSSAYQLLSEFIHYVIYTERLFAFSAVEMKNRLYNIFGFEIPEAVVKTATRSLPYLNKENGVYTVKQDELTSDTTIEEARKEEAEKNSAVIKALEQFIIEKQPDMSINEEQITRDLVAFLVEGSLKSTGQYFDLISEFILKKEDDVKVQECLKKIREGSILYIGITYNINETGSFKKTLTLYLDTEILFSLAGYNGEIYKTLAEDFFLQVRAANLNGEKIKLTYFPEVEKEIEDYFKTASSIVEGKSQTINKPAMASIINGCTTSADVEVKKSDFYHVLGFAFGVHADKKQNYYTEEDNCFNLESMEYTDSKDQESWRFISHINKLRKAQIFSDNTEAEYLFVTNTYNTIKTSREYAEKIRDENGLEYICDYAVNLDRITNIIWYKLGNGFGKKAYPNNVSAILSARIALASCISHNVERVYAETKEQFKSGTLTEEQLAARIITLRKKPTLPEEIEGELIEDSMDFSPEYLSRFEEEVKENKALIEEKDRVIRDITEQSRVDIKEKDEIIAERDRTIETEREEKMAMAAELEEYHKKDERAKKRKLLIKKVVLFSWSILWKILVIVGVTAVAVLIENKLDNNIPLYVGAVIDIGCVIYTVWSAVQKDFKKHFKSQEE